MHLNILYTTGIIQNKIPRNILLYKFYISLPHEYHAHNVTYYIEELSACQSQHPTLFFQIFNFQF